MTDIAPVVDAPAADAPVVDAPVTDAPVVDAPVTPDAFDDEKVESFDRAYVTKLREEAAKHRTANKPYADAFSSYSEEERAVWMELATGLVNDPTATAERMQGIVDSIRGEVAPPNPDDDGPDPTDDDAPLTKKQMQEFLAERDKAADLDKRVANIKSSAEKLGYKEGSIDYRMLLITAQEQGGDLDKAHAAMQASRQGYIADYLASKKADAEGASAPGDAAAPSQVADVNTWEGARAALLERLRAKQAQ